MFKNPIFAIQDTEVSATQIDSNFTKYVLRQGFWTVCGHSFLFKQQEAIYVRTSFQPESQSHGVYIHCSWTFDMRMKPSCMRFNKHQSHRMLILIPLWRLLFPCQHYNSCKHTMLRTGSYSRIWWEELFLSFPSTEQCVDSERLEDWNCTTTGTSDETQRRHQKLQFLGLVILFWYISWRSRWANQSSGF